MECMCKRCVNAIRQLDWDSAAFKRLQEESEHTVQLVKTSTLRPLKSDEGGTEEGFTPPQR